MRNEENLLTLHISLLKQGKKLLDNITDEQYVHINSKYHRASAGKHIRHILDHYQGLLNGWNDKVDYDDRTRDTEIETDRQTAINNIELMTGRFRQLRNNGSGTEGPVLVKSNTSEKVAGSAWSSSTIMRELQFLISHTVHHYALVAIILRIQDVTMPEDFGVAPSTLDYYEKEKQASGSNSI